MGVKRTYLRAFLSRELMQKILTLQKLMGEPGLQQTPCMYFISETLGKVSSNVVDRSKKTKIKVQARNGLSPDTLSTCIFVDKVYVARATVLPVRLGRVPCSCSRQIRNKNGAKWMSTLGTNHPCGSKFLQTVFPSIAGIPSISYKYIQLYEVDKSVTLSVTNVHTLHYF